MNILKVTIEGDSAEAAAAAFIVSRSFTLAGVVTTPNVRYTAAIKPELLRCMMLSQEQLCDKIVSQVEIHFSQKEGQ